MIKYTVVYLVMVSALASLIVLREFLLFFFWMIFLMIFY